jgi:hypothetical protein
MIKTLNLFLFYLIKQHKTISFYPCCLFDFIEPYNILSKLTDEVIFCDISKSAQRRYKELRDKMPQSRFILADAIETIEKLQQIDIFFYRKDSGGEGGSRIFFFGDKVFPILVKKFNPNGAEIISDGSNARGKNWSKMKRNNGVQLYDRYFKKNAIQNYLELEGNSQLISIKVLGLNEII